MKIYISKFWPYVALVFGAFWFILLSFFVYFVIWYSGLGNSILGLIPFGLSLLGFGMVFTVSAIRTLRLSGIPILIFSNDELAYRHEDKPSSNWIPYREILSVEITENLSKYSPSMLVITLENGSPPVRLSPQFSVSNEMVMTQFETHCVTLHRRNAWQWKHLQRP